MSPLNSEVHAAPLDLIVLAELLPATDRTSREYGRPHRIDRDSLDKLLAKLKPSDPLAGASPPGAARIASFRDFRPEAMRARWLDARVAEARSKLDAASAPPPVSTPAPAVEASPASDDPLARLFDLVDTGGGSEQATGASLADRLVSDVVKSVQKTPGAPAVALTKDSTTEATLRAEILRAALASTEWRALEGAWLALRLLVRRVDFRSGIRLYVIPSASGDSTRHLRAALEAREAEADSTGRVAVAVVTWEGADGDAGAAKRLEWNELVRAYQVPLVSPANSEEVEAMVRGEGVASSDDASTWLSLTAHRFLARPLYGASSDPTKGFAFEEVDGDNATLPWVPSAWLLALAIARSFAQDGLGTEFTARPAGEIEDLPLAGTAHEQGPVDRPRTTTQLARLALLGVAPLAALGATDRAFFPFVPVASGGDAPEQRLAHRILTARVCAATVEAWEELDRSLSSPRAAEQLHAGLMRRLHDAAGPFVALDLPRITDASIELALRPLRGSLRDAAPFIVRIAR